MTDNEIIARFMGVYQDNPEYFKNSYESSWDWLMPVVDKISKIELDHVESADFTALSACGKVTMLLISNPIDEVYKEVVEFIKWYNSQNP